MKHTVESLLAAIRTTDSLEELKRLAGPSVQQLAEAEQRLHAMQSLQDKCNWGNMFPDVKEQAIREHLQRISAIQAEFENQYF